MANKTGTTKAAIGARTFGAARSPASVSRGGGGSPDEVLERLWALCGALPPAAYAAPWSGLARELRENLAAALAAKNALSAAETASRLSYLACTRALARGAPAVNRAVSEVRGLALAADALEEPPKTVELVPGAPLVYEPLVY